MSEKIQVENRSENMSTRVIPRFVRRRNFSREPISNYAIREHARISTDSRPTRDGLIKRVEERLTIARIHTRPIRTREAIFIVHRPQEEEAVAAG